MRPLIAVFLAVPLVAGILFMADKLQVDVQLFAGAVVIGFIGVILEVLRNG